MTPRAGGPMPSMPQLHVSSLGGGKRQPPPSRGSTVAYRETRAAWSEDGPVSQAKLDLWSKLVKTCSEERELPTRRGLFVGIAGVFYAAKSAGCDGQILPRN